MRSSPDKRTLGRAIAGAALLTLMAVSQASAASFTLVNEDFESYTGAATSITDTNNANPPVPFSVVADDNPLGFTNGAGVQLINFLAHSGNNSLLLRSGTEFDINFAQTRSGTSYQVDYWTYAVRQPTSDRNFLTIVRGQGADLNGDDMLAYRVDRVTNSVKLFYYDGVAPGTANWVDTAKTQTVDAWQHHRMIIYPTNMTFDLYIDDMTTPALTRVELARSDVAMPIGIRIQNEGNSADDGYFAIDDIVVTVEGSRDLSTTFTDGFEGYAARTTVDDDADPAGFWITSEADGTGGGKVLAPGKVQVVDNTVVQAHSGTKCLKLEAGQRAGVTLGWGTPPQQDVQITWWARVPEAVQQTATADAVLLRMSLYGMENGVMVNAGNTVGDNMLLGWGIRRQGPSGSVTNTGDTTSLLYFSSSWFDTGSDYTPNVWEEYRVITHTSQGRYTILKNPSSANPQVIVDRAPMIGSATNWNPVLMLGFSSSNGTNHPPVYVDDIEIKSLVSNPDPLANPYTIRFDGTRFTNVTTLTIPSAPIGDVAVDPRDNSTILFTVDVAGGGIYKATKVASGNWAIDPTPIVSDLDRPSGLVVADDGTIWWTHDFTMALMRLKAPWSANTPELVVTNFGNRVTDDDPIDLVITPSTFNGTLGAPGMIAVADRGSDGDETNAVNLVLANSAAFQTNNTFLIYDANSVTLGNNLNAITALQPSGEVVTLSGNGYITAIDGNGTFRYIDAATLWPDLTRASAAAIAADPTTGRLWVIDDILDEIWSIASDGTSAERKELGFVLTNPTRPDFQIDAHEPGMVFAPNGAFMVITDSSTVNGGGRIHIFHNEKITVSFKVTAIVKDAQGVKLSWQSANVAKYDVLRGTDLTNPASFQAIATDVTTTQYTDATPPAGGAYYKIIAKP